MATEFGASIKLDSRSALKQMQDFAKSTQESSKQLARFNKQVKLSNKGFSNNAIKGYVSQVRSIDAVIKNSVKNVSMLADSYERLASAQSRSSANSSKIISSSKQLADNETRLSNARQKLKAETKSNNVAQAKTAEIYKKQSQALAKSTIALKKNKEELKKSSEQTMKANAQLKKSQIRYEKLAISQKKLQVIVKKMSMDLKKSVKAQKQFNRALRKTKTRVESTNKSMKIFTSFAKLSTIALRVFIGVRVARFFGNFITSVERSAEKVELLTQKMTFLTGDRGAYKKIFELTQQVGLELNVASKIMTRFAIVTSGAFSTDVLVNWTANIVKSARATGTSVQEMNGALIQITQALSSGRLAGDEFRSVTENLPLLTVALRRVVGESEFSLKELSSQGKLTVDVLTEAFDELGVIMKGFPDTTQTIDAAFDRLSSSTDNLLSNFGKWAGLPSFVKGVFGKLTTIFNDFSEFFGDRAEVVEEKRLQNSILASKQSLHFFTETHKKMLAVEVRSAELRAGILDHAGANELRINQKKLAKLSEQLAKLDQSRLSSDDVIGAKIRERRAKRAAEINMEESNAFDAEQKSVRARKKLIRDLESFTGTKAIVKLKRDATEFYDLLDKNKDALVEVFGSQSGVDQAAASFDKKNRDLINDAIDAEEEDNLKRLGMRNSFSLETIRIESEKTGKLVKIENDRNKKLDAIQFAFAKRRAMEARGVSESRILESDTLTQKESIDFSLSVETQQDKKTEDVILDLKKKLDGLRFSAEKTSAVFNNDFASIARIDTEIVEQSAIDKIRSLRDELVSAGEEGATFTNKLNEGTDAIRRMATTEIDKIDLSLVTRFEGDFDPEAESIRGLNDALVQLNQAREILNMSQLEYLRQKSILIDKSFEEVAIAQAVNGTLSETEQIYAGLQIGVNRLLEQTKTVVEFTANSVEGFIDGTIEAIISNTESAEQAFKKMVASMILEMAKLQAKKALLSLFNIGLSAVTGGASTAFTSSAATSFGAGASSFGSLGGNAQQLLPFASGGSTPGGLIMAGERGRELIAPPQGSRVFNAQMTKDMMRSSSATVVKPIIKVNVTNNGSEASVSTETSVQDNSGIVDIILGTVEQSIVENGRIGRAFDATRGTRPLGIRS